MLFAPGIKRFFATHPDLEERLKAIDPRFDKSEFAQARARLAAQSHANERNAARDESPANRLDSLIQFRLPRGAVTQLVGNPGTRTWKSAQGIRQSLPEILSLCGPPSRRPRARCSSRSRWTPNLRPASDSALHRRQLGAEVAAEWTRSCRGGRLLPQQRMPVLMHAFPALRQLTREERIQLIACLNGMLQREGRLSLRVTAAQACAGSSA